MTRHFLNSILFLAALALHVLSQDLPGEIRGYKVHTEKLSISAEGRKTPAVSATAPKLVDMAPLGVTFEVSAEMLSPAQSGKVDFLMFHDVRVNGVVVSPEEYRHAFAFQKGVSVSLPEPIRIFLPVTGIAHAAWLEMKDSKPEWKITGRIFVFGRFRKYGMHHKRAVPVDIDLTIKNPLPAFRH